MQLMPSRQQRAVKSQIFIHHVTSAVIIYFWVSIDVKTFQVLKNITKLTINEQEQGRTKNKGRVNLLALGKCLIGDRKYFLAVTKKLNLHISFLQTQQSDYGLYEQIEDHSSYVFIWVSDLVYQVDLKQHNVC